jgi:hypothetical protein
MPAIKQLCARRAPSTESIRHPEVLELALGTSTAQEYVRACEWIKEKHQQTRDKYGILLPAADVECLQIQTSKDFQSLEQILADIVLSSGEHSRTFSLPPPPTHGVSPGKSISLPVLFMYGSIDWQLHIRLGAGHASDGKSVTFVCSDPLPLAYLELIALLEPAMGIGIDKDYEEFFGTVSAFWPSHGAKPAKPIELSRITMLAGCAISHVSVLQLVYTFLGGYLCKDWRASTGDRLWARPYASLPVGLQCYLHGDIQQVAITAWVAVTVWTTHLFPDSTLATRASNLTPLGLLNWWTEVAVKSLMRQGLWTDPKPGYVTHREGAIQHAGVPRTEATHALLRLCPSWPAITTGGCREFHHAGLFIHEHYNLLMYTGIQTGYDAWPNYDDTARAHMFTLGLNPIALPLPSTAPSSHAARSLHQQHQHTFFELTPERVTREELFSAATALSMAKRPVFLIYHKLDVDRAVLALELWETQPQRILNMLGMDRGGMIVRDCREFLWSVGRLRTREPGWKDPYNLDERATAKRQSMVDHLQLQWSTQAEAARQQIAQEAIYQESARLLTASELPAGAALGPFLTTVGAQITGSTLSLTGRSRSARRRKRRELSALEAIGLRVPGPNAQLPGKGPSAEKRPGLTARTDPTEGPTTAAAPHSTASSTTTSGGVEVGKRPGLTTRTDPAKAPPVEPRVHYIPDTEPISEEDVRGRVATSPRPRPIPVIESRTVHFVSSIPIARRHSPQPGTSREARDFTPPRQQGICQMIGAARGRARSRSGDRSTARKREPTPSPPRMVVEKPAPIPEDDEEEEVLIIGVTPADTGFLGPIQTRPTHKRRK